EISRLVSLELKTPPEGASPTAQFAERQLRVVMEDDLVVERRLDGRAETQRDSIQQRIDILQGANLHLEPEAHFQARLARTLLLELHLVVVVDREVNLREGDILLRVKVVGEVLVGEDLFAKDDALAGIHPAESPRPERTPADDDALGTLVLEQNQIVIAKG